MSGAEWGEDTLQGGSHYRENPYSPTINCHGVQKGSNCGPLQEEELTGRQECLPHVQNDEEADYEEEGEADRSMM